MSALPPDASSVAPTTTAVEPVPPPAAPPAAPPPQAVPPPGAPAAPAAPAAAPAANDYYAAYTPPADSAAPQQPLAPPAGPVAAPLRRAGFSFDRSRLFGTIVVAAIVAGTTLGGIGLDKVIAAPSAGQVALGNVHITAESGWAVVPPPDGEEASDSQIQLQKGDVVFTAFYIGNDYAGDRDALMDEAQRGLDDGSSEVRFQERVETTLGGDVDVSAVGFTAILNSQTLDGELLATVYYNNGVIFEAFAPQGDLDPAQSDIEAMVGSLEVEQ